MRLLRHQLAAWAALLLAILIAAWAVQPPPVRDEPGRGIDVSRAMSDLREIAREPHVTGSPANARVRDVIVARFAEMGIAAEVQRGNAVRQSARKSASKTNPISIAPVENIVAVLPGRDRTAPAVLVMAHYDAVPFSYGASDDGAGTVSLLAAARTLAKGPAPARDVIFLVTDAEEHGLIGAHHFFANHPLAPRVGIVVNAEARGSRGRAMMFQTSPGNAALVDLWADAAISPSGNSLSDAIYRLLPNDTDMSVSLAKNVAGINAAFIDGHFDYHSTTDRIETLDPRTLQHLGDFTITTTRALALAPALPARVRDASFFDVFGLFVVRYPFWLGWIPLLLAAIGLVVLTRRAPDVGWARKAGAFAGVLGATAALGTLGHFAGVWTHAAGSIGYREAMAEAGWLQLALIGLVVAAWLLVRAGRALMLAAIALLVLLGTILQIWMPGGAFLFALPALVAVAVALVRPARRGGVGTAVAAFMVALTLGFVFQYLQFAYVSVGLMTAGVFAIGLPFMIALLTPLAPEAPAPGTRVAGAFVAALSLGVAAWLGSTEGFSARQPRPGDFFALHDMRTGTAYWATSSGRGELPPGQARKIELAPVTRAPLLGVAADIAPPSAGRQLAIDATVADGAARWRVSSTTVPRLALLALRPAARLTNVTINGAAVRLVPGEWTLLTYRAAKPLDVTIRADAPAGASPTLEIRSLLAMPGLPAGAPRGAGLHTNWTQLTGTEVVIDDWPRGAGTRAVP